MAYSFKLPDIGEGIHEGEIVKWHVSVGDFVEEEQIIVEVMTDKATVDLTSPVTGKVTALLAEEGQTVIVGQVFIEFEEQGGKAIETKKEEPHPKSEDTPEASKKPMEPEKPGEEKPVKKAVDIFSPPEDLGGMYSLDDEKVVSKKPLKIVRALPRTRKLAKELGINITEVPPTGPDKRITDNDVRIYADGKEKVSKPAASMAGVSPASFISSMQIPPLTLEGTRKPLTGLRKKIAQNMEMSNHLVPRAVHFDELDLTQLVELRKRLKPQLEEKGIKLTYLPFFIKVAAIALKEFPQVNACFDEEDRSILELSNVNVGFAADTKNGLMVPILKDADKKSIKEIAGEISKLAADAREGKISVDDLKGGGFTLTNIGSIGGMMSVPVVYHPQAAIMGMHSITPRPVVRDGEIVIRDIMYISLAFDHRIIDGADAARFAGRMKQLLENPVLMVMEMI